MKGPDVNPPGAGSPDGSASFTLSLLVLLRARDPEAWRRLTSLYGPVVYRWCRRAGLRPEDAADVGQEIFLAVAAHIADFRRDRDADTFGGWLWTIAQNKLRDHWRRQAIQPEAAGGTSVQERFLQVPGPDDSDPAATTLAGPEADSRFRLALEQVRSEFTERTWQAFWRVTAEGHSAADVAGALGMSPGAVYVAKSRVLRRFRDEFADLID